jgi:gamma-glutamyl-gamma-aminobutyrate hydrolase PuuD
MTTLAVVRMGTGVAKGICKLFDNVVEWSPAIGDYDAIHFEGGSDIHPDIYNHPNVASHVNEVPSSRDNIESTAMRDAISKSALIIGSCRGAQLACAFAGGKLVQHVDNHAGGGHDVMTPDGESFKVTSAHHQMLYPWDVKHELLAWSAEQRSARYLGHNLDLTKHTVEPEAVYFPTIRALAFQWHPEWEDDNTAVLNFTINAIKSKL